MQSEFSSLLRTARKEKNLTQKGLAELLGVSTGTVQQWELGTRFPRVETLKTIEEKLEIALVPQKIEDDLDEIAEEIRQGFIQEAIKNNDVNEYNEAKNTTIADIKEYLIHRRYTARFLFQLEDALEKLNLDGQREAVKRVEEMTRLVEYQRTTPSEPLADADPNTDTPE